MITNLFRRRREADAAPAPVALFEPLEPRQLLAGHVTAAVVDGHLFIRGDHRAQAIIIETAGLGEGEYLVRAIDENTRINGQFAPLFVAGVTKDVRVSLGRGDDVLEIDGAAVARDLGVSLGGGDDRLLVRGGSLGRRLRVRAGGGSNEINLLDAQIAEEARVRGGGGRDLVTLDGSTFGGEARFDLRGGDDVLFRGTAVFNGGERIDLGRGDNAEPQGVALGYDFALGDHGWTPGFADTFEDRLEEVGFEAGIAPLPAELGEGQALRLAGTNLTDDLFMFIERRIGAAEGIEPGRTYQVRFDVTFATDVSEDCGGIGGSPGASVYLKAGATPTDPEPVVPYDLSPGGMNIDIGDQANGGRDASVVGHIGNGLECAGDETPFASVQRRHVHTALVAADANGELHLIAGTDSGFEGRTTIFLQRIEVTLVPVG